MKPEDELQALRTGANGRIKRRAVIRLLLTAAAVWSVAAVGQQPRKIYSIGMLETVPAARNVANLEALRLGLRDLGYVEGQNLIIEYRSADGHAERFPDLASELVRLEVDLIVTRGTPATRAVQNATRSIPVVMAMGAPGAIVASLARPGGNITGVATFNAELTAKRTEILKELAPSLSRVGLLHNMGNPAVPPEWQETETAARFLGLEAELLDVRNAADLDHAFELAAQQHVDGLVVGADSLIQLHQRTIIDLAARNKLPAVYPSREFVEGGGLVAYSVSFPDLYLRLATFIDKIFKGEKPGDIPVEQPTKFELVINSKTAKALSLTIPLTLLLRSDEVIE